ncbi:MAG: GHKL domain-containing protein [Lachnospiraceae bacterium]|nr:GHKL domain-containing protein [Lachnospiraceae bacterium]
MLNTAFLISFLYETFTTLPYRLLAYYPFRRQLRCPLWTILLVICSTQLLHSSLYAWMIVHEIGGTRLLEYLFAAICMLIFLCSIDESNWKQLFLYILLFDYIIVVRGVSFFIEARLFYRPDLAFDSLRSFLLNLIVLGVSMPFMIVFLKRFHDTILETEAPSLWRVIWILPAFSTLIVLMYTSDLSPDSVRQLRFFIGRVLLLVTMFGVYGILLQSLDIIRQDAALAEQAVQQENLLALQRTQYNQLARHMEETRQARHDLGQHLRVINSYLSTGNEDMLKEYVENYQQSLPPDTSRSWCKNYAVNTIISYYFDEAEHSGIDFTAKLELPERLPVSEPEFCSMIGNLLENALLACRDDTETAPFIRVLAKLDHQRLLLTVDNTAVREPAAKYGRFLSSRHEGYGLGTASVRAIAQKHHGQADYRWENGIFYASILMRTDTAEVKK